MSKHILKITTTLVFVFILNHFNIYADDYNNFQGNAKYKLTPIAVHDVITFIKDDFIQGFDSGLIAFKKSNLIIKVDAGLTSAQSEHETSNSQNSFLKVSGMKTDVFMIYKLNQNSYRQKATVDLGLGIGSLLNFGEYKNDEVLQISAFAGYQIPDSDVYLKFILGYNQLTVDLNNRITPRNIGGMTSSLDKSFDASSTSLNFRAIFL